MTLPTTIYSSETDANSPLNQTLMDKIREWIDFLSKAPFLLMQLSFVAEYYGEDSDGSDDTTIYENDILVAAVHKQKVCRSVISAGGEGTKYLFDNEKIRIPADCVLIKGTAYVGNTPYSGTPSVTFTLEVGSDSDAVVVASGSSEEITFEIVPSATGTQGVSLKAYNANGSNRAYATCNYIILEGYYVAP